MTYGDWPAVAKEHYDPEDRFEQDTEELLQLYDEAEHPGWKAEFAYSIVELAYEEGLETGDDDLAREVHTEVARPLLRSCFTRDEEPEPTDMEPYAAALAEVEGTNKAYGGEARLVRGFASPRKAPYSFSFTHPYQEFADDLAEEDLEEYDTVISVWSSGVPLADLALDGMDADERLVRYSPSRGDDTVIEASSTSEIEMGERALIADDVCQSGESLQEVAEWARGEGAEQVDAAVMAVMDQAPYEDETIITDI